MLCPNCKNELVYLKVFSRKNKGAIGPVIAQYRCFNCSYYTSSISKCIKDTKDIDKIKDE